MSGRSAHTQGSRWSQTSGSRRSVVAPYRVGHINTIPTFHMQGVRQCKGPAKVRSQVAKRARGRMLGSAGQGRGRLQAPLWVQGVLFGGLGSRFCTKISDSERTRDTLRKQKIHFVGKSRELSNGTWYTPKLPREGCFNISPFCWIALTGARAEMQFASTCGGGFRSSRS